MRASSETHATTSRSCTRPRARRTRRGRTSAIDASRATTCASGNHGTATTRPAPGTDDGGQYRCFTGAMTRGGGESRGQLVALQAHLLDRVEAAVLVTDFSGTVLYANPYCEVLYGLGPDELVGENARKLALQPMGPELLSEIAKEIFP